MHALRNRLELCYWLNGANVVRAWHHQRKLRCKLVHELRRLVRAESPRRGLLPQACGGSTLRLTVVYADLRASASKCSKNKYS